MLYSKLVSARWPYHVFRIGLGLIFACAGLVKLLDPRAFARALAAYDLVPDELLPVLAVGLPALELLSGIGLILDRRLAFPRFEPRFPFPGCILSQPT